MSKYRKDEIHDLAAMFKALSNPQRLKIFLKLADCCSIPGCCQTDETTGRRCAGELGEDLDLAASTVSHHLKELRQSGLMEVERRGQKIECRVSGEALRTLAAFLGPGGAVGPPNPNPDPNQLNKKTPGSRKSK